MGIKMISFSSDDEIRLRRIVIDGDRDDAFVFAKELLERLAASSNKKMKNHLDS